ncbi:MAG: RNA methyltransferase [Pseudomonadota bacterium]
MNDGQAIPPVDATAAAKRHSRKPGRVHQITSVSNPIIKGLRGLTLKKNRDAQSVFIAEGLKHTIDALDRGWVMRTVVTTNAGNAPDLVAATAARARASGADILEVSEKVMAALVKRDNAQPVLSVIDQNWSSPEALLAHHTQATDTLLVLDRVRDPGNLGTIIRTVDAVGAKRIWLVGDCTDPFSLEAVRASMGSLFHVEIARSSAEQFIALRARLKGKLLGTHLKGAVDWRTPDYAAGPIALVMGNEREGMPKPLADACDALIRMPMAGGADSLNLAVATGLTLFEARRHLLTDGGFEDGAQTQSLSWEGVS